MLQQVPVVTRGRRLGHGLVVASATVLLLWWVQQPPPLPAPPGGGAVPGTAFASWVPALREGAEVQFAERVTVTPTTGQATAGAPAKPLANAKTLGPLSERGLRKGLAMFQGLADQRFAALGAARPAAGSSYALLLEAEALFDAEEALAAAAALRAGSYFTTAPGPLPPAPPDCGCVQYTSSGDGKPVVVTVLMPFADYPRLGDAYRYRAEVKANHPAAAVEAFNAMDEAWRRAAVSRWRTIMDTQRIDREDQAFQRQWFPVGVRVDAEAALLSLP